jgi:hypothetical protein
MAGIILPDAGGAQRLCGCPQKIRGKMVDSIAASLKALFLTKRLGLPHEFSTVKV